MKVKIADYGEIENKYFIDYEVLDLNKKQLNYLNENLSEETLIVNEILKIRMYFTELYPFKSDAAKIRIDDFIAREEIEMNVFLSSFLEDMD